MIRKKTKKLINELISVEFEIGFFHGQRGDAKDPQSIQEIGDLQSKAKTNRRLLEEYIHILEEGMNDQTYQKLILANKILQGSKEYYHSMGDHA